MLNARFEAAESDSERDPLTHISDNDEKLDDYNSDSDTDELNDTFWGDEAAMQGGSIVFNDSDDGDIVYYAGQQFYNTGVLCHAIKATAARDGFHIWKKDSKKATRHMCDVFLKMFGQACPLWKLKPFIAVDGWQLGEEYGGIMFTAVGLDANEGIWPVAVYEVDDEPQMTWTSFFEKLGEVLRLDNGDGICVLHDGDHGVSEAMESVFCRAEERLCAMKVCERMKKRFPYTRIAHYLWRACRSTSEDVFKTMMQEIRNYYAQSITKRFNGLATKRKSIGDRYYSDAWKCRDKLTPVVRRHVMEANEAAQYMNVVRGDGMQYTVEQKEAITKFFVHMGHHSCSCGMWQISGIPCAHAYKCISHLRGMVEDFVHPLLKTDKVRDFYTVSIQQMSEIQGSDSKNKTFIRPPREKNIRKPLSTRCQVQDSRSQLDQGFNERNVMAWPAIGDGKKQIEQPIGVWMIM
ncbi:hypothetical protein WN943_023080 [Citrus x changshan-huyou]